MRNRANGRSAYGRLAHAGAFCEFRDRQPSCSFVIGRDDLGHAAFGRRKILIDALQPRDNVDGRRPFAPLARQSLFLSAAHAVFRIFKVCNKITQIAASGNSGHGAYSGRICILVMTHMEKSLIPCVNREIRLVQPMHHEKKLLHSNQICNIIS